MRRAQPQSETAAASQLSGQRLLGHGDGMSSLDRYDGAADFDALGDLAEERDRGHGVEVPGNLRNPEGRETSVLGGTTVGDQTGQAVTALPFLIGADHQT